MRYARHSKILELISSSEIDTQDRLADKLQKAGFNVTQATVSRDIKELGLIKVTGKSGRSCYAQAPKSASVEGDRYSKILKETIQSVKSAQNMVVIHTLPGCANAAAEVIDKMNRPEILGTIAGDNTVFVVADTSEHAVDIISLFEEAAK